MPARFESPLILKKKLDAKASGAERTKEMATDTHTQKRPEDLRSWPKDRDHVASMLSSMLPEGYSRDEQMKWWQKILLEISLQPTAGMGSRPGVTVRDLKAFLSKNEHRIAPHVLKEVVEHMMSEGILRRRVDVVRQLKQDSERKHSPSSIGTSIANTLVGALTGMLGSMSLMSSSTSVADDEILVVMESLEGMGEVLVEAAPEFAEDQGRHLRTGSYLLNHNEIESLMPNGIDKELLQAQIATAKNVWCETLEQEHGDPLTVYKWITPPTKQSVPLTNAEKAFMRLLHVADKQTQRIDLLEEKKQVLISDPKFHELKVKYQRKQLNESGMRILKGTLKRLKRLSSQQWQYIQARDRCEDILAAIEQAHSDKEMLDAYKVGERGLRSFIDEQGLTVEAVDDAVVMLEEALQDVRDVNNALAQGPQLSEDFDDEELDAELDRLADEAEREYAEKQSTAAAAATKSGMTETQETYETAPSPSQPSPEADERKEQQEATPRVLEYA
eukprot:Clim_evm12s13 gene=Clim_evmTU12s13